jgi:hypothetical protein
MGGTRRDDDHHSRHHRVDATGRATLPGPEDGGGRPARGRDRPRLQQPDHRHPRLRRLDQGDDAQRGSATGTTSRSCSLRPIAPPRSHASSSRSPGATRCRCRCCSWMRSPAASNSSCSAPLPRQHRAPRAHGAGDLAGGGRRGAHRAGPPQPPRQRARRDAARRDGRHRDRQRGEHRAGRGLSRRGGGPHPRLRQWRRHPRQHPPAHLPALLHHEGVGQGDGARPGHLLRHRPSGARRHQCREHGRRGDDVHDPHPEGRGRRDRGRPGAAPCPRSPRRARDRPRGRGRRGAPSLDDPVAAALWLLHSCGDQRR